MDSTIYDVYQIVDISNGQPIDTEKIGWGELNEFDFDGLLHYAMNSLNNHNGISDSKRRKINSLESINEWLGKILNQKAIKIEERDSSTEREQIYTDMNLVKDFYEFEYKLNACKRNGLNKFVSYYTTELKNVCDKLLEDYKLKMKAVRVFTPLHGYKKHERKLISLIESGKLTLSQKIEILNWCISVEHSEMDDVEMFEDISEGKFNKQWDNEIKRLGIIKKYNRSKVCEICGQEKSLNDFNEYPKNKDGYRTDCKQCQNQTVEDLKKLKVDLQTKGEGELKCYGDSMTPMFESGDTVQFNKQNEYKVGDCVFCEIDGRLIDCHLVADKDKNQGYLITDSKGNVNGWTTKVYGKGIKKINFKYNKMDLITINNKLKDIKSARNEDIIVAFLSGKFSNQEVQNISMKQAGDTWLLVHYNHFTLAKYENGQYYLNTEKFMLDNGKTSVTTSKIQNFIINKATQFGIGLKKMAKLNVSNIQTRWSKLKKTSSEEEICDEKCKEECEDKKEEKLDLTAINAKLNSIKKKSDYNKDISNISGYEFDCPECNSVFETDTNVTGLEPFVANCPNCDYELDSNNGIPLFKTSIKKNGSNGFTYEINLLIETDERNISIKNLLRDSYLYSDDFSGRVIKSKIVKISSLKKKSEFMGYIPILNTISDEYKSGKSAQEIAQSHPEWIKAGYSVNEIQQVIDNDMNKMSIKKKSLGYFVEDGDSAGSDMSNDFDGDNFLDNLDNGENERIAEIQYILDKVTSEGDVVGFATKNGFTGGGEESAKLYLQEFLGNLSLEELEFQKDSIDIDFEF